MRKYDSYKDSGINWVQQIPNHWSKNKFKFLFNEKKSTLNPSLNSGSISFGEVIYKDDESIPESTKLSYQEVLEGEFLINPLNLNYDLKSLRIGRSKINVVVSQGYIVLQLVSKDNPEYFRFLLRDFDIRHLKSLGSGVRQTISFTHLKSEELPLPPLSEQEQIVSYLDKKTEGIDKLIQTKVRKIELLKEYRTSLISKVVTKGLNPNVEMKDSGVEWIGEIPSHWYCIGTNKVYHDLGTGTTPTSDKPEYYDEFGFHWITTTDLNEGIMSDTLTKISKKSIEDYPNLKLYPSGSIFISMYGGRIGKLGVSTFESFCNQSVCVLPKNDTLNVKFYYFWFFGFQEFVKNMGRGGGQPNINKDMIKQFPTVKLPLSEQEQIVSYLDEQTQLIDKNIQTEERKIELLKEFRQSLISEVVTGKIKVCNDEKVH